MESGTWKALCLKLWFMLAVERSLFLKTRSQWSIWKNELSVSHEMTQEKGVTPSPGIKTQEIFICNSHSKQKHNLFWIYFQQFVNQTFMFHQALRATLLTQTSLSQCAMGISIWGMQPFVPVKSWRIVFIPVIHNNLVLHVHQPFRTNNIPG